MIVELIKIVITSFSLAYGWIESPLFEKARKFVAKKFHPYLTYCYHCVGFYAGILAYILSYLSKVNLFFDLIYNALFLAGCCLLIYRLFFIAIVKQ